MPVNEVLDDRFELGPLAGEGAMGVVHRAVDRTTGAVVAVKLLLEDSTRFEERFRREAAALARVDHPGVVRYVTHGVSSGRLYLAMEWLEGETLSSRLARGKLRPHETLAFAESLADGLAALHASGVVHRDLKPSNLWLVDGDLAQVKILDLGIAHLIDATRAMTRTGDVLGTPSYMAPEQVRGLTTVDVRADVHAFGVVVFEALTGKRPFAGADLLAIALKVLLEVPPRLTELEPDTPPGLDRVVAAALRKVPNDRPADGAELVRRLAALREPGGATLETEHAHATGTLTTGEQRLLTIVLAEVRTSGDDGLATTLDLEKDQEILDTTLALRDIAEQYSASIEALSGKAHAIVLSGFASARDQAAQAARCALRVSRRLPDSAVALATGRGELEVGALTGVAIDRAVAMLHERGGGPRGIRVDEVTAGLLDERFEVGGDARGLSLRGEREPVAIGRPVAGRTTPFVGRDREVMTLEALVAEAASESVARVAIVTAPAGTGKSRLRHEAITRIGKRDDDVQILRAYASPLAAGSSFGLIAEAVRGAARLSLDEDTFVQRKKLAARVGRHVSKKDEARVVELLAEMLGLQDGEPSTELRAARQDPKALGERIQKAFVTWLEGECQRETVVLVLEDLHWGDRASVAAIDQALRALADKPFVVLAFARPEVHAAFPDLFRDRGVVSIELAGLSKRAATKLVKDLLADATDDTVEAIVTRANGNAFFLEELVRAFAAGTRDVPETVLAMVGARLASLEVGSRRVLRAASIFGRIFPGEGTAALIGDPIVTGAHLVDLEQREVIVRQVDARFGDDGWAFVHELACDAAYATLTTEDRALGHRIVGEWLEANGEKDPLVLATHFERGGALERAAVAFGRAAAVALEANDFDAVLDRAKRANAAGISGIARAKLRRIEAEVYAWKQSTNEALACAEESLDLSPPGSVTWFAAAAELISVLRSASLFDRARELAATVVSFPTDQAPLEQVIATLRTARTMFYAAMYDEAVELVTRIAPRAESAFAREPFVLGELAYEQANIAYFRNELDVANERFVVASKRYQRGGHFRRAGQTEGAIAYVLQLLGRYKESAAHYRYCISTGWYVMTVDRSNLAVALARSGDASEADEALEQARQGIASSRAVPRINTFALAYAGLVHLTRGELDEAEGMFAAARERGGPGDLELVIVHSGLVALTRFARGDAEGMLAAADEGLATIATMPRVPVGELRLRWARAAALRALQDPRAEEAATAARDRLVELAGRIRDPELRRSYVEDVPEHAWIARL